MFHHLPTLLPLVASPLLLVTAQHGAAGFPTEFQRSAALRARADDALERGAAWLADAQAPSGALLTADEPSTSPLLTTALALWVLAEVDASTFGLDRRLRAVGFLCRYRDEDGAFRDEQPGLELYSTALAAASLRAVLADVESAQLERFAADAERYVREHLTEQGGFPKLAGLVRRSDQLPEELSEATRFLDSVGTTRELLKEDEFGRLQASLAASQPPTVFADLRLHASRAELARVARAGLVLDRVAPVATRFVESRFLPASTRLAFSRLALARSLAAAPPPDVGARSPDGGETDWTLVLGTTLLDEQRPDGSWSVDGEAVATAESILATTFNLQALRVCRDHAPPMTATSSERSSAPSE